MKFMKNTKEKTKITQTKEKSENTMTNTVMELDDSDLDQVTGGVKVPCLTMTGNMAMRR